MRINDCIVTSLESLKANFDFIEIWNKREIAIRDLSPNRIFYSSDDLVAYYDAFAHPENVIFDNGQLFLRKETGDISLSLDINNVLLKNFSPLEKIQVLALYRLAQTDLTEAILEVQIEESSISNDIVNLKNGKSLVCKTATTGSLTHKIIKVDSSSKKASKVGEYILQPGQVTYGVFCENSLIAVAPPYENNSSFLIEYELVGDDVILVVTDVATNTQVARYANGHFYSVLGDNDFVVINGLIVSCFNDEGLNNRLRQTVVKVKSPEIVEVNEKTIKITYKDNTTEIIQI